MCFEILEINHGFETLCTYHILGQMLKLTNSTTQVTLETYSNFASKPQAPVPTVVKSVEKGEN